MRQTFIERKYNTMIDILINRYGSGVTLNIMEETDELMKERGIE